MRSYVLAFAAVCLLASPALAQTFSGRHAPSHRVGYMPRAATKTTVRYAKQTNVEAVVASHGYATRTTSSGCCDSGCDSCAQRPSVGCCQPALLPCVLDNIQDALICLIPTRAHCCPYPKSCGEPSCSNQPVGHCCDRQPLFNSLLSRRCGSGCGSCTARPSCGCTAGEAHGMHLMSPPVEELEKPESPFRDDPDMPMQRGARKPSTATKSTQQWFKKTNAAPVRYAAERPAMIIVGAASPIVLSE